MATEAEQSSSADGWSAAKKLYEKSTTALKGKDLLIAALEYTNEELREQANDNSRKQFELNTIARNIPNAVDRQAAAEGKELESYGVDYYNRRGNNLKARFPKRPDIWRPLVGKTLLTSALTIWYVCGLLPRKHSPSV